MKPPERRRWAFRLAVAAGFALTLLAGAALRLGRAWRAVRLEVQSLPAAGAPPAREPEASWTAELAVVRGAARPARAPLRQVQRSEDERFPEMPPDLVQGAAELDAILHGLACALDESPPETVRGIVEADAAGAETAWQQLAVSAIVAADRGDLAVAECRLRAAWSLNDAIGADPAALLDPGALLGVLRRVPVRDPEPWLGRLDAIDVRTDRSQHEASQAKAVVAWVERDVEDEMPAWPRIVRVPVLAAVRVPMRFAAVMEVRTDLRTRAVIRSLDECTNAAAALRGRRGWLPVRQETELRLARLAREEAQVALTRAVLLHRARRPLHVSCPPAEFHVEPQPDGRVRLVRTTPVPRTGVDIGRHWHGMDGSPLATGSSYTFTP